MGDKRHFEEIVATWASGQTLCAEKLWLAHGAFGTLIVPSGSALIGKALQFVALSDATPANFADTDLLSTALTLAAGANALDVDQIRECGAAGLVRLKVDTAVGSAAKCVLLWKA